MSAFYPAFRDPFEAAFRGPFDTPGPATNPRDAVIAALFGGGEQGAYWDDEDDSTAFTDAAATDPAGQGDPLGARTDVSGNGHDLVQDTSSEKPLYPGVYDNVDDFMVASGFSTGGLYDLTIAVKPDIGTGDFILATGLDKSRYLGAFESGSSGNTDSNSGTPSYNVNGEAQVSPDRASLWNAITIGEWNVIQITDIDVSNWAGAIKISGYGSGLWPFGGQIGGIIFREQMTADERKLAREAIAEPKGVTL